MLRAKLKYGEGQSVSREIDGKCWRAARQLEGFASWDFEKNKRNTEGGEPAFINPS